MSTSVEAPPERNYGKETRETLQAQIDLAPDLYESEAKYRPEYADLERGIMLEQLGIDPNVGLLEAFEDYIAPSQQRQKRTAVEGDIEMVKDLGKELVDAQREADPLAEGLRQKVLTGAGDLADRMEGELDGDFINSLKDEVDGTDVQRLRAELEGGDVQARREELDGDYIEGLRDEMTGGLVGQLQEEYNAGGGLTQQERRDLDQQVLGMAQERGAVGQNMTDFARMRERLTGDRGIRQQRLQNLVGAKQQALQNYSGARQQALQNYAGTKQQALQNYTGTRQEALQNFMGAKQQGISNYASALQGSAGAYQLGAQDPLMALTGRASRVPGDVSAQFGTAGFALDSSPAIFNPESAYAGNLATQNYQGQMDARVASASNRAGMFGGLLNFGGSVLGGMASGGTGFFR